ncbi:MAG: glutaredoxin family protein [Bacillota bacterium]
MRPELPPGLGLPRRSDAPMRMPRMNFPMVGGAAESTGHHEPAAPTHLEAMESTKAEEGSAMEMTRTATTMSSSPVLVSRECTRVIVYGRAGCPACVEAIQDLIDRQVCFTYHDVSRDERAMAQLQAICGDSPLVPVIIQVGVQGG